MEEQIEYTIESVTIPDAAEPVKEPAIEKVPEKVPEIKPDRKKPDRIDKRILDIKEKIDIGIPDYYLKYKFAQINKTKRLYFLFIALLGLCILAVTLSIMMRANYILIIAIGALSTLIVVFLIIFSVFRLFVMGDWERIRNRIIMNSGEYIIATFFSPQKRKRKRYVIPAENGREFKLGKGIYIIDLSCVWTNEQGIPEVHYVSGIPNPLDFDFTNYLTKYFDRLEKGENDLNIKEKLDVRYSSENLQKFKDDEMLNKMHHDPSADYGRMILYILAIVGIMGLVMIILIITNNKQPIVNVINSTTTTTGPMA